MFTLSFFKENSCLANWMTLPSNLFDDHFDRISCRIMWPFGVVCSVLWWFSSSFPSSHSRTTMESLYNHKTRAKGHGRDRDKTGRGIKAALDPTQAAEEGGIDLGSNGGTVSFAEKMVSMMNSKAANTTICCCLKKTIWFMFDDHLEKVSKYERQRFRWTAPKVDTASHFLKPSQTQTSYCHCPSLRPHWKTL